MFFNRPILREIITILKNKKGASLTEISEAIPKEFNYTDSSLEFLTLETLEILNRWGIIEVYDGKKIIDIDKLFKEPQYIYKLNYNKLIFYISKTTVEMEAGLGLSLGTNPFRIFGDINYRIHSPDLFVLMPFSNVLTPVYEDHIKNVANDLSIKVGRADDIFSNNSIMSDIYSAIYNAKIIIADCTNRNSNVFYEIGIAHTLSKETIIITQNIDDIPFDLRHLRIIVYSFNPRGMKEFENKLRLTISNILEKTNVP